LRVSFVDGGTIDNSKVDQAGLGVEVLFAGLEADVV